MRQSTRVLAILGVVLLMVVAGCSRASYDSRLSSAGPSASAASQTATPTPVTPIPGHPPVTTTGVVAKFDPATGVLAFQDGRMVQVTDQSQVLEPKVMQRLDPGAIRPGHHVVVQNALPIGVRTAARSGKRQRMATIASVNQQAQTVQMTDGSVVHVTPSTNMHKGVDGVAIVLTDLRPGDEVVVVMTDEAAASTAPTTSAAPATSGAPATGTQPSALPSQARITGAPSDPTDASELMVFRESEAP